MTRHALSPAQEAIWFEDKLQQRVGNTGFFSVTLTGELREEHVEAACAAVVHRHSPLRAVVRMIDDQPFLETVDVMPYERVDVPCAPGEEIAATRSWRDRSATWRFDLTREPTLAFRLLRHGPQRRTLLMVGHHLSFDGRSKFVFARDFAAALTALRAGSAPATEVLPWPVWPAASDELVEQATRYWRDADLASCRRIRLPRGESVEPAVGTTGEWFVDGQTRERLAGLAHEHGTTLFGGLLAALAVTLYGYGNRRMVLCAPVDVTTPETRNLIGLGVNIVPFVLSVDGDDTFVSAIATARAARGRLREFQLVPFRSLGAVTASARALFSRISVSYQRIATDVPGVPGLHTTWDFVAHNSAETFDLMMHLRDAHDRLLFRFDYSGADVDAGSAAAIGDHLRSVLSRVLDRPDTPLRALDLMRADSVATRPAVVSGGAEGSLRSSLVDSLVALCEARAARHPDRAAVAGPGGSISYRELAGACRERELPTVLARTLGQPGDAGWVAPPSGHVAAALSWQAHHLDLAARPDRMLQLAEPGSAGFWQECWLAWASGGTLCLPPGPVTGTTLHQHGITTAVAPFHVLRRLAGEGTPLQDVITSMAELRPSTEIARLVGAGVRLHAQYTVDGAGVVAIQACTPDVLASGYAPVLRELAPGVRISVCEPDGHVLPRGVTGRLLVNAGATRYAPADLGHVDRSGAVHLHGAETDTVEWAGQSLTIPALERHLAAHPDVEEAVVVCRGHRPAVYLVPRAGTGFGVREARLHLRRRSVPGEPRLSHVHVVADLPRTPDGRIDRHAVGERLPDPEPDRAKARR